MSGDEGGGGQVRRPRVIGRPQLPPGPLADLKALIYELYLQAGEPTLDEITRWIGADQDRLAVVGRDTVHRIIADPGMPGRQVHMTALVTALARAARWDPVDAAKRARDLWVEARTIATRSPANGIRVSQADPRRLGAHAAISVPGVPDEIPPEYVPRDADDGEFGVRAKVAAAARRGGFVLLTGGSSVGKTRCAFEAIQALLPDWWLVHPAGTAEVAALAAAPVPRVVIWLDELQRYLDGERGLTAAVVRALLNAPDPVVIIGTLWPDRYTAWTAMPASGAADLHARERQLLEQAEVVRLGEAFSPAEQDRAREAAARDPRLKIALETGGYGLTQTLAAAPQLVARWEDARAGHPYAWAVLTAALDAARLGARAPLTIGFLRAAAWGYCSNVQEAEAPENWFEQALAYATGKLHGGAAALRPAGAGMGHVVGYSAADYLIQHATQDRRYARPPASTWDAILRHIRAPADIARLADSARNRLLFRYAIPLYRHTGNKYPAGPLAELLAARGDLDGATQVLRTRADAGDQHAAWGLVNLLAERGDLDGLRARADDGDVEAAMRLVRLLARRGDLGELRGCGHADVRRLVELTKRDDLDGHADAWLTDLASDCGDLDELRARADAGDQYAAMRLAERDDLDGLRTQGNADDGHAAARLADVLRISGDLNGAVRVLRVPADAGDQYAAMRLAGLLAEHGDLEGLRTRTDAGDVYAAVWLAGLLAERGDLDGAVRVLRARADAGDQYAAVRLADVLAKHDALDGIVRMLRAQADAGDQYAAMRLANLLVERGDLDRLRARADAGDQRAAWGLVNLLAERGDLDGLRARIDVGDLDAAWLLADALIKQGRSEDAERLRRFGLNPDGSIACA